jgi:hypothetical protein
MFASADAILLKAANPLVQKKLPVEDRVTQPFPTSFAGRTNDDSDRILAAAGGIF